MRTAGLWSAAMWLKPLRTQWEKFERMWALEAQMSFLVKKACHDRVKTQDILNIKLTSATVTSYNGRNMVELNHFGWVSQTVLADKSKTTSAAGLTLLMAPAQSVAESTEHMCTSDWWQWWHQYWLRACCCLPKSSTPNEKETVHLPHRISFALRLELWQVLSEVPCTLSPSSNDSR